MIFTYQRVSTKKQSNERQEFVFEKEGIKSDKDFKDKITGTKKDRPELNKLKLEVKKGDIIYVESISRLGRNLKDTIEICDYFIAKGVKVVILKEGIDTTSSTYKLLLAIFGAVAEMERDTIQERVSQRIDQLKEDKEQGIISTKTGRWFGREEVTKEFILNKYPKFERYLEQVNNKVINKTEMAKMLGVGRATLYRYIDIYNGKNKGE